MRAMKHANVHVGRAQPFEGADGHRVSAITNGLVRTVREHPIAAGLGALSAVSTALAAIKARRATHRASLLGVLSLGALAWRVAVGSRLRHGDRPARLGPVFPAPVFTPPRP